jgi:hypothetical protein
MKTFKRILLMFIATTVFVGAYAQVADTVYYKRLYYTCKAWGHAKYYHSRIAAGEVDWDDVLINALPGIKNAPTNQAFNDSLFVMLMQAGETQAGTAILPEVPDSLNNNKDLTWIYHPIFSNAVSSLLDTIIQRFTPRSNVYVVPSSIGHPDFKNDKKYYSEAVYPDESKRILSVFRYWNIIHYFFPYKYIMDQNWDTILIQTIPAIVKASNALEYHLAMREFTAKINDSHASYSSSTFTSWRGNAYTPFLARYIEGKVVITKVHSSCSTVYPGDVIKKIDGFDIDVLRDSLRKYAHGSNEIAVESNLINLILFGASGDFPLSILNETGEHTVNIKRGAYYNSLTMSDEPYYRKIIHNNCRFGIVYMGTLENKHFPGIIDSLNSVDAIIFDIRNYPNGTLLTLVDYMFEDSIHIANFTFPDINYPGRLYWQEEWIGEGTFNPVQKKVMILFDERTQSHAEYTCMGLEQIPGVIKIGSTTSAADGNVSEIHLPGKIQTMATFLGTYYPDYTPTQRVGIIPDYEVCPTIQGIREGRDEVLEFALNCAWLGIENNTITEEITIYPNPTTGKLSIEVVDQANNDNKLRIENVEIFDVYGRTVLSHTAYLTPHPAIDISHLPAGLYFVKITTDSGEVAKKVVKM